jgi:hypothetical protein
MEQAFNDSSNLTGLGALFLAVTATLMFALPRRLAILPVLATVCYMPLGQRLVIAGLHFTILRLLIVVGIARVLCRGEVRGLSLNRIDKLFLWWAVLSVILGFLSKPDSRILVNRLGIFYNTVAIYFLVCCWVRDAKSFVASVKLLALLVTPLAVLMIVEKTTSRNIFSVFGGVPEFTDLREGHLRCQAAFRHPILAGTFGATSLPLFIGLWFQGRRAKTLALLGAVSACTIAIAAYSGGALLTMLLAGVGFGFWPLRHRMRLVRRGIVALILALAIVMQAPVWYLTAKASNVFGGGGWYRARLIDITAAHISEWWLCGTAHTAHWGGFVLEDDPDNIDITSQYVVEAVKGGALKLILFMAIIVQCFKVLGRRIQAEALGSETAGVLWWAIGVCLFTHCVSFWSIPYFDQLAVLWYWLLAAISRIACDAEADPARLAGDISLESTSSESPLAAQGLVFQ